VKRKILLVDDDMAVLLTLKAVLELHQFDVHTATSAADAETKLAADVYHLVITDARMETDDAGAAHCVSAIEWELDHKRGTVVIGEAHWHSGFSAADRSSSDSS
jgi:DNA-binding NtrC family response regulator